MSNSFARYTKPLEVLSDTSTWFSSRQQNNIPSIVTCPYIPMTVTPTIYTPASESIAFEPVIQTGYNRNSRSYKMKYARKTSFATVINVTAFNKYIFENMRRMKQPENHSEKKPPLTGIESVYHAYINSMKAGYNVSKMGIAAHPISWYDDMWSDNMWVNNACALHLIGTPEDVEDLSMFPGLIVSRVYDNTQFFTEDYSILQNQHIKYNLETYFTETPKWWLERYPAPSAEDAIGLYEYPYSESASFQDPASLNRTVINICYEHMINPDERVYKIYIRMSDDLIATVFERPNFFIDIRNNKKNMSIKNFIEYLS